METQVGVEEKLLKKGEVSQFQKDLDCKLAAAR